jgi:hypothetical protein
MSSKIRVNRAPVLTMWAAVVAERLGFDWKEALSLGRAVAGLNAYSKGVRLGLFQRTPEAEQERLEAARSGQVLRIELLHRAVPAVQTPDGVRALSKDRPIDPGGVERYLRGKFGEGFAEAKRAMERLARSKPPDDLTRVAYLLYEKFRPAIAAGARGWGAQGDLDLAAIATLADEK